MPACSYANRLIGIFKYSEFEKQLNDIEIKVLKKELLIRIIAMALG